jgi:hypothetical protein
MGDVVKFRARLTPSDVEIATIFGIPVHKYAEQLAASRFKNRQLLQFQMATDKRRERK